MIDPLLDLMRDRQTVVLAGAGCSTESGIPDYRGPEGRLKTRTPVQYGDFVRSEENRRRYWARSTVGWRRVSNARPNPAHRAIAVLESSGLVGGVITQNVDGLHHAAGSRNVIELHGSLDGVVCLGCGDRSTRREMQERLEAANVDWVARVATPGKVRVGAAAHSDRGRGPGRPESAPDGDAELLPGSHEDFVVPECDACGGILKPDVVFFGENVPKQRVAECWAMIDQADALLVAGSSLTVYSGRRFIYGAAERSMPIGVVNLGPTRADDYAAARVDGRLGEVMPLLAEALLRG